ncbi:methionine--tRNA ligase [Candidatus Parcubacteria bacterium]|nr:methionine--tRNA ligase [Patescibacteria group bacterium]MCG2693749.1 methionine--tRNA ligase [Candidatus Parcubacteria bacterium]
MEKYYITTPIYYINDKPHIGHAYTTIVADALARYNRQKGRDVLFLTGTDENSQKNISAAEKHYGKENLSKEDVQKYLNDMAGVWRETWKKLNLTNDDFIRTTEERHVKAVKKFLKLVWDKDDIYKGSYEGYYCEACEAFIKESDLEDGKCPDHKQEPKKIKEENYFFRLSKYREKLLDYIEKNPDFIMPKSRKNEVVSYIKDFMEDVSITREGLKWGITVPEIPGQALYVWFDALINYLSAIGFVDNEKKFAKYWPVDLHLVGKDIIKFHCALWPAMLLSAELPLPRQVFAHGFFTIDGAKMSKTLGNVVNPVEVAKKYGNDTLRYYLLREIPFGEDGDFSIARLEERYNSDLANGLGNLVSRTFALAEKHFDTLPELQEVDLSGFWKKYEESIGELKLHNALALVWEEISKCDIIIDKEKPWELAKTDKDKLEKILGDLLFRIKEITRALEAFLPETSEKILGLYEGKGSIKENPLFPRLDK